MKIAIYGKPYHNDLNDQVGEIIKAIEKRGFEVELYEKYSSFLRDEGIMKSPHSTFNRENVSITDYICLISIGGDGTLLDTVTLIKDSDVPIVGLNAGRLGFISSISVDELEDVLDCLKNEDYQVDQRSLIQVETERKVFGDLNFGLNELTVHKKDTASMITIEAYINDEYLNTYWADGIIASTATGSTAYSLSCGGPIIVPGSENIVITPIAPHNLNIRPVVVSNDVKLRLSVDGRSDNFLIALDSRSEIIYPKEDIFVSRAPFTIKLIRPKGHTFLNTMRNKLTWGLDKRN